MPYRAQGVRFRRLAAMHQSNYVAAGCGYDWTAELGGWDTFIAEGWVQTLIAFFILVMSARVLGKFTQLYTHQLVGYMLLGFVCTASYMLSMMRHEFTLEFLRYVAVLCKAFIAFETGTHLATFGELKQYAKSVATSALLHVACCFLVGMLLYQSLVRGAPVFSAVGAWDEWGGAPMLSGTLATATAIAIGVVMTAGEPTCCAEIVANAHATGLFTAAGLRSTSGTTLRAIGLLSIASPIVANLQFGAAYWAPSLFVSLVFTAAVGLFVWRVVILVIDLPFKAHLTHSSFAVARSRADEFDRLGDGDEEGEGRPTDGQVMRNAGYCPQ